MLVSSLGNPLICPILPPTDHLINEGLMKQISQPQSSWGVADDDGHGGTDSIVGFAPIAFKRPLDALSLDQNNWYAFIRQHPSESFAPVYSLLTKVGILGFGLVFVISSLGYLVGKQIVKPILLLKERAQAIGQASYSLATQDVQHLNSHHFGERIEVKSSDEIQELAQAFNQMSLALEESLHTIKKQQKELVVKNELASIGQLLAGLTHDLKNPLGIIRSSAQILNDKKEPAKVKKEVGRYIIEEVDRLTYRINDFLRFARPRPPDNKPVHLEKIIERSLWQWAAQGEDYGKIKLIKEISFSLPMVNVDPEHLLEALFNLLNNAREVMPEGGTVTLRVCQNQEGLLEISIQDTGEGIATEDMGKIFDPFFTTKEYGIGLGLTNVKRLIEDNGGRIIVQSQKDQGTTFTILFPPCHETEGVKDDSSQVAHY
jgi:signal transduction histidine kinase